jgi:hypothetical protein
MGVSKTQVERARKLKREAPEEVEAVRKGKKTIHAALKKTSGGNRSKLSILANLANGQRAERCRIVTT